MILLFNDGTNDEAVLNFHIDGIDSNTKVNILPVNDSPDFNINDSLPEVSNDAETGLYKLTVQADGSENTQISISYFAKNITAGPENESDQYIKFIVEDITNPDLFYAPPKIAPSKFDSLSNAKGTLSFDL